MAKVVGLDIFGSHVLLAELESRKSGAVRVLESDLPLELTRDNAERLGHWLRDRLAESGIAAKDLVCTLGRDRVALKSLEVPVCPDNELAAIVAFESDEIWNQPGVEPVVDFQAGPIGELGREVFVAMAPAVLVETIRAMVAAAGLTCHRITLRPHATHFAWQAFANGNDGNILFVVPGQHSFELSIWQRDQLASCRSLRFSPNEDPTQRVVSEIRRTIVSHHSHFPDAEVERVVVCAPNHYSMSEALREALGIPVDRFDLTDHLHVTGGELSAGTVAGVGAALQQQGKVPFAIDLLHPKKPEVVRDRTKSLGVLVAVLIAMVPISGYVYARKMLNEKQQSINLYAEELNSLNTELSTYKPTLQRHQAISQWNQGNVNWLHELQELAARMPDTSEAYLTNLDLASHQGRSQPTISVSGRTRHSATYTERTTDLAQASNRYAVTPKGISAVADGSAYSYNFGLSLAINPFEPEELEEQRSVWNQRLDGLKPPDGQRRVAVSLRGDAKSPSSTTVATGRSSQSQDTRTASVSSDSAASNQESTDTAVAQKEETKSESPSSSSSASSGDSDLISELKALPYDEREERIKKAPKFLQEMIRKKLKESP